MVAVTYGVARAAARKLSATSQPRVATIATPGAGAKKMGFFTRFMLAMQDARMRQAERELAHHRHLTNWQPEDKPVSSDELPFRGR